MRTIELRLFLLLLLALGAASLAYAQSNAGTPQQETVFGRTAIAIGPGDLLDLTVFNVPELVLKVRVDSNGVASFPLVGDLKLAGLTTREAQLAVAHELVERQLVLAPQVSVLVEEFATQGITVYGEVNMPGIYPLIGPHNLYDAISAAGGFTVKAGHTVTIIHTGQKDHPDEINLSNIKAHGQNNVMIQPGDTVIVSKAGVVYVLGEVNKPGSFLMENNTSISLMKAIALAQGTTKIASSKHVIIFRKSEQGISQTNISLDRILHGKDPDLQLNAEDTVFIPLSNLKSYGALGLQGAVQAAVYTIYAAELH
jgi:polysaccharide export outer membrane protein